MPKYTFLLTIMTVVLAGTLLNAQDQPLRFDGGVLEMVEIVTKSTESPRSSKISAAPSKQLKPAHDVWQQWEKLKSAEKPPQSPVNADTPLAELKRLAEEGHKDALNMLQTRLRQMIVDKDTSSTMLTALAKIGHTDALRILKEQEKQREEDVRRKQREEKEKAKIEREKEEAKEQAADAAKKAEDDKKRQEDEKRLNILKGQAAEGNKVAEVFATGEECYFIKKDGTLWGMDENSSPILIAVNVKDALTTDTKCYFHKKDGTLWDTGTKIPKKIEYIPDDFGFALYNGNLIKEEIGDAEPKVIVKGVKLYAAADNNAFFYSDNNDKFRFGKVLSDGSVRSEIVPSNKVIEIVFAKHRGGDGWRISCLTSDGSLFTWYWTSEIDDKRLRQADPQRVAVGVKPGIKWLGNRLFSGEYGIYFIRKDNTLWYYDDGSYSAAKMVSENVTVLSVNVRSRYFVFVTKNGSAQWSDGKYQDTIGTDKPLPFAKDVVSAAAGSKYVYLIKEGGELWKIKANKNAELERIEVPETPLEKLVAEPAVIPSPQTGAPEQQENDSETPLPKVQPPINTLKEKERELGIVELDLKIAENEKQSEKAGELRTRRNQLRVEINRLKGR